MLKHIPETILTEHNIMHQMASTGAILQYLPHFFHLLANTKGTAFPVSLLEADLKRTEKVLKKNMSEAKEWVMERIDKLRSSPFAKHPLVTPSIERAESSLHFQDNQPPGIFLDRILSNLQLAVTSVASFGNDPLFDGWAEIGTAKKDPNKKAPHFPKQIKGIFPIENRWELADHFGHGVDCWQVTPITIEKSGKKVGGKPYINQHIKLLYGHIVKLIFPSCIESIFTWKGSNGLQKWREKRDSDLPTLFGFLKVLSNYGSHQSIKESPFMRPKTIQEAEELCIQGEIRPYLHQFSLLNPEEHPLSQTQLLNLIDAFLNMLEVQIIQINAKRTKAKTIASPRAPSKDPRKRDKIKAVEWMKNEWAKDENTCQDAIVDRLKIAISNGELVLEGKYVTSTFETWVDEADPLPIAQRRVRDRTKNVKHR
jgi:hypothetical protein